MAKGKLPTPRFISSKVNSGNKNVTLDAGKMKGKVSILDTARRLKP